MKPSFIWYKSLFVLSFLLPICSFASSSSKCVDIFSRSPIAVTNPAVLDFLYLSDQAQLNKIDSTKEAHKVQEMLDQAMSFEQYLKILNSLKYVEKNYRKKISKYDFQYTDYSFYNLMSLVDFVKPLLKIKKSFTDKQKRELLNILEVIHGLDSKAYRPDQFDHKSRAPAERLALRLLFYKEDLDAFIELVLSSLGVMNDMQFDTIYKRRSYFNTSVISIIENLSHNQVKSASMKLRATIAEQRSIEKTKRLLNPEESNAARLRRRAGEVLLNFLEYRETIQLIKKLNSNPESLSYFGKSIDDFFQDRVGKKPEIRFLEILEIAKIIQRAVVDTNLNSEFFLVGSLMNGRFQRKSSDIDIIFEAKADLAILEDFKKTTDGMAFNEALTQRGEQTKVIFIKMTKDINSLLGREEESPVLNPGIGQQIHGETISEWRYNAQRMYVENIQPLSLRIHQSEIFLNLRDAKNDTTYEWRLSTAPLADQ